MQDNRIDVLDGLRALAIMLVLTLHSIIKSPLLMNVGGLPAGLSNLFLIFHNGWSGVDLFFVLSGFLITRQLLAAQLENRETRGTEIKHYLKKRFFRIVPAYYFILPIYAIIKMIGGGALSSADPAQDYALWGWRVFYHLLFLQDYLGPHIVGLFWSLAIEAKFYLLAPFILMLLFRLRRPGARFAALAGLVLLPLILRTLTLLYVLPAFNDYDTFFFNIQARFHLMTDGLSGGMLCAFLWNDEKIRVRLSRPHTANLLFFAGAFLLLLLLGGRARLLPGADFFEMTGLISLVSAGFCMMLLGLVGGCAGCRLFKGRALRYIARISYSLYLVHLLALPLQIFFETGLRNMGLPPALAWTAAFTPYFVCALCLSHLLYTYVEQPFIRLAHKRHRPC